MRFQWNFLVVVMIAFTSCKHAKTPETETVQHTNEVYLNPYFGTNLLSLDSVYTFANGYKIQFTDLKCYISSFSAGSILLRDYALFDYRLHQNKLFSVTGAAPVTDSIAFGVGVPAAVNHNDPVSWPENNPLNITVSNDMHWDWNPGYIFIKLEAKVDTIPDGVTNLDHLLTYHIGTDAYYSTTSFTGASWNLSGNKHTLQLKLDMEAIFNRSGNEVDIRTEFITHSAPGQEVLTEKIRTNFVAAISLE